MHVLTRFHDLRRTFSTTQSTPITGKLPKICLHAWNDPKDPPELAIAWDKAIQKYFQNIKKSPFEIIEAKTEEFDPKVAQVDCIVSPANSFGIMDNGYDLALSKAFKGPSGEHYTLTDHVQSYLREYWRGYIPPGSCCIIPLPSNLAGDNNPWKARFIAVVPVMRVTEDMSWHVDLVYNSMWSLLVAVDNWNREHGNEPTGPGKIKSILTTGLGVDVGNIGVNKSARQMILAARHFTEGLPRQVRWKEATVREKDILETIRLTE